MGPGSFAPVTLPIFSPTDDPGPNFAELLRRVGLEPPAPATSLDGVLTITHGTTVVAVRYADGVVMAGDRRATTGNLISHRAIEKVFPADRHSGVAIAGAAGPAMEMVKLFQLQLEHYEKVEASALSLEGKANQLSAMVRNHLPAAMQGLAVVPLFAGYDLARGAGRLFQYDVTGGRYEETNYAATGSGSLHAGDGRQARLRRGHDPPGHARPGHQGPVPGGRRGLRHRRARPGPGHLPDHRHHHRRRLRPGARDEIAERFGELIGDMSPPRGRAGHAGGRDHLRPRGAAVMSMPFYVAPEQVMKDRADYARKGIARGRSLVAVVYDDGILICAENPSSTLRKVSEIYDRIAFAGVGKYNEFDQLRIAGVRAADLKGYAYSREDVDARSLANQYAQILGQVFTHEMKPMEVEILVAEVGRERADDQLFHILYDGTVMDEEGFTVLGGEAEAIDARLEEAWSDELDLAGALRAAVSALAGPDRTLGAGRARGRRARADRRAPGLPSPRGRRASPPCLG